MTLNNTGRTINDYKLKETSVGSRLSDFEIVKQLGKGSYGTVYVVRSKLDMNKYVMKKMELNHLKENQQRECYREVSILRKVSHPNIIKYYSSFLENESLCIIMEYAELGDLYTLIKHYKKHQKSFEEIILWRVAYEVLNGLEYLHSNNIIHRDIKCLNLFLSKDHHVKIGDLGVSTITSLGAMQCTRVGTPLYLSPELIKQIPYDYKTDIWSFGCSLYHMANLDPPFLGSNLIVLGNNIVKGRPKELPNVYSKELKEFIGKMLTKKADKRPSAKEAKNMIPQNMIENILLAYKNKEDIKARPFSSIGNRKSGDVNVNNKDNNNLNINNNNLKNKKELIILENNISNLNNNNNNNNNINEDINKKEKKNNNVISENNISHNKEINIEEKHEDKMNIREAFNKKIKNETKKEKEEPIKLIHHSKLEEKTNDEINIEDANDKNVNLKRQSSNIEIGIKSSSLYNVLNLHRNFNIFRNKNSYKNSNEQKSLRNMFNGNNKIIKNNSIRVYSSMIKNEFSDLAKKEKLKEYNELTKEKDKEINIKKKDLKKLNAVTDTNIQLISINNNNIIINQIKNDRFFPTTISNKAKEISKLTKNMTKKSNTKNNNILFPDLRLKKNSSTKDKSFREINNNFTKNNSYNEKKIFAQKLISQKHRRPYSSGKFNPNLHRNFENELNINNSCNYNHYNPKKSNSGRPLTGFKPTFNNNSNVMNININFYNIDMNRRFLAPEINPLNSNDIENFTEKNEVLKRGGSKSNINLKDFQNNNEFIFQKLIKALQDINNDKKLTINDLQ